MTTYNKLTIIGYLARDPEQRALPSGEMVSSFTVPITERRRNTQGAWYDGATAWYRVSAFGKQAEVAAGLVKGTPVFIEGTLLPREWNDREGALRTSLNVRCRELRVLERRSEATVPTTSTTGATDAPQPESDNELVLWDF